MRQSIGRPSRERVQIRKPHRIKWRLHTTPLQRWPSFLATTSKAGPDADNSPPACPEAVALLLVRQEVEGSHGHKVAARLEAATRPDGREVSLEAASRSGGPEARPEEVDLLVEVVRPEEVDPHRGGLQLTPFPALRCRTEVRCVKQTRSPSRPSPCTASTRHGDTPS